jgi:hypothetical protein
MDAWICWRWFDRRWWGFLLEGRPNWRRFWCRVRGHPYPVHWFKPWGSEPDMRCRNCDEDLG